MRWPAARFSRVSSENPAAVGFGNGRIPEHKHQLVSAGAPFHWMVRRGAADKLPSAPIKSDGDLMSIH